LWPGQFANVRLKIDTLREVVTIPTGAVQRGPEGTFVYVITPENTAAMRRIVVQKQDEMQTVVKSGLTPPERVVTTGFTRLTEGAKVTVSDGSAPVAPATRPRREGGPAAVGQGGERRRGGASGRPQQ
jgi:multidrug efflux system membrane fusion protein